MKTVACLLLTLGLVSGQPFHSGYSPEEGNDDHEAQIRSEGNFLVEGDIELSEQQYRGYHGKRSEINGEYEKRKGAAMMNTRWKDNTMHYYYDSAVQFSDIDKNEIEAAMRTWEKASCFRFVEITPEQGAAQEPYVEKVTTGGGCSANIGFHHGEKNMRLAPDGCRKEIVVLHELGHALGFTHEQNRPDRDDYVIVNMSSVEENKRGNYQKGQYPSADPNNWDSYGVWIPYDYGSIMHYGPWYFATSDALKNNKPCVRPINGNLDLIGRRDGLTFKDIKMANLMYSCNKHCDKAAKMCKPPGYLDQNCECACPPENPKCDLGPSKESYDCSEDKNDCQGVGKDGKCSDEATKMKCPISCKVCFPNMAINPICQYGEEASCHNGHCIPLSNMCDGKNDCGDNSDETKSYCPPPYCPSAGYFRCPTSRECVQKWQMCDGVKNCDDGSDEASCCDKGLFKCDNEKCVDTWRKCIGRDECGDMSFDKDCCDSLKTPKSENPLYCAATGICHDPAYAHYFSALCPQ